MELETVHYSVLKAVRIKPEQKFVGLFAKIKEDLLKANLLSYEGHFKYALTDLGRAILGYA